MWLAFSATGYRHALKESVFDMKAAGLSPSFKLILRKAFHSVRVAEQWKALLECTKFFLFAWRVELHLQQNTVFVSHPRMNTLYSVNQRFIDSFYIVVFEYMHLKSRFIYKFFKNNLLHCLVRFGRVGNSHAVT